MVLEWVVSGGGTDSGNEEHLTDRKVLGFGRAGLGSRVHLRKSPRSQLVCPEAVVSLESEKF